jgi:hypothetical protein
MIDISDFLITGSFKIGTYKFNLNDLLWEELIDLLGTPSESFLIVGHEQIYLDVFIEYGLGRILVFGDNKTQKTLELHFEPEHDILIKDLVGFFPNEKPKVITNKKLKYIFFCPHMAGRLLSEREQTINILGFFSQKHIAKNNLPFLFLSGIAYDKFKLITIHKE